MPAVDEGTDSLVIYRPPSTTHPSSSGSGSGSGRSGGGSSGGDGSSNTSGGGASRHPIQPQHAGTGSVAVVAKEPARYRTRRFEPPKPAHPTAALTKRLAEIEVARPTTAAQSLRLEREFYRIVVIPRTPTTQVVKLTPATELGIRMPGGFSFGRGSALSSEFGFGHWFHDIGKEVGQAEHFVGKEAKKHALRPIEKYVVRPVVKELGKAERELHVSFRHLETRLRRELPHLKRILKRELPHLEKQVRHELPRLEKEIGHSLPSAASIARVSGEIATVAQLAAFASAEFPPAAAVFEAVAIGAGGVSLGAAGIDADMHPRDPNKLVDFLVEATIARAGESPSEEDDRRVRAAASIVVQMYYDVFVRPVVDRRVR